MLALGKKKDGEVPKIGIYISERFIFLNFLAARLHKRQDI